MGVPYVLTWTDPMLSFARARIHTFCLGRFPGFLAPIGFVRSHSYTRDRRTQHSSGARPPDRSSLPRWVVSEARPGGSGKPLIDPSELSGLLAAPELDAEFTRILQESSTPRFCPLQAQSPQDLAGQFPLTSYSALTNPRRGPSAASPPDEVSRHDRCARWAPARDDPVDLTELLLGRHAHTHRTAVISVDVRTGFIAQVPFYEVLKRVRSASQWLRTTGKVGPGDIGCVALDGGLGAVVAVLALWAVGARTVILPYPRLPPAILDSAGLSPKETSLKAVRALQEAAQTTDAALHALSAAGEPARVLFGDEYSLPLSSSSGSSPQPPRSAEGDGVVATADRCLTVLVPTASDVPSQERVHPGRRPYGDEGTGLAQAPLARLIASVDREWARTVASTLPSRFGSEGSEPATADSLPPELAGALVDLMDHGESHPGFRSSSLGASPTPIIELLSESYPAKAGSVPDGAGSAAASAGAVAEWREGRLGPWVSRGQLVAAVPAAETVFRGLPWNGDRLAVAGWDRAAAWVYGAVPAFCHGIPLVLTRTAWAGGRHLRQLWRAAQANLLLFAAPDLLVAAARPWGNPLDCDSISIRALAVVLDLAQAGHARSARCAARCLAASIATSAADSASACEDQQGPPSSRPLQSDLVAPPPRAWGHPPPLAPTRPTPRQARAWAAIGRHGQGNDPPLPPSPPDRPGPAELDASEPGLWHSWLLYNLVFGEEAGAPPKVPVLSPTVLAWWTRLVHTIPDVLTVSGDLGPLFATGLGTHIAETTPGVLGQPVPGRVWADYPTQLAPNDPWLQLTPGQSGHHHDTRPYEDSDQAHDSHSGTAPRSVRVDPEWGADPSHPLHTLSTNASWVALTPPTGPRLAHSDP